MTPEEKRERNRESARKWRAANREKTKAYNDKWRADPDNVRRARELCSRRYRRVGRGERLQAKYGISAAEFDAIFAKQNFACAICYTPDPGKRFWHVDHCHHTGRVRGILCKQCNNGIGMLCDDPTILEQAIKYLTKEAT